jgi:hypothetical protein
MSITVRGMAHFHPLIHRRLVGDIDADRLRAADSERLGRDSRRAALHRLEVDRVRASLLLVPHTSRDRARET